MSKNKAIVGTILRHDPDFGTIRDFKITMINMLNDPMEKVDNLPEQLGSFSRDRETIKESNGNTRYNKHNVGDDKLL